jgi:predicted DNA-binding protein YlxM (UPF0122 family)
VELNNNVEYKYRISWASKLPKLQGKEQEIMKLHIEDRISVSELSKMYGCSRKPIQRIITNNGGKVHPTSSPKLEGNEDEILKMYMDDELTIQTIRKKIGCSYSSIQNLLKRESVKLRTATESRKTDDGRPKGRTQKLINPEELKKAIELYENGEVLEKIGKLYNITARGLQQKFIKAGVHMRTLTESANLPATHERKKATNIKNRGVDSPMKHPDIAERSRKTTMDRYGSLNSDDDLNPFCKRTMNAFKYKSYKYGDKQFDSLQGYEPQAIKFLIDDLKYDPDDIESGKKIPTIKYIFNGVSSVYFPDLYIKKDNLLIEVKCKYTYDKAIDRNIAKRKASLNKGYHHITIMFNSKGKKVIDIF